MKSDIGYLSEKEQILLMRFADGECSSSDSKKVEVLLAGSPAAEAFLSQIGSMAGLVRSQPEIAQPAPELWKRVMNRIEQEERSALFLGQRRSQTFFGFSSLIDSLQQLGWKMYAPAAAAVAFCALFVVRLSGSPAVAPVMGQLASENRSSLVNVSTQASEQGSVEAGYSVPVLIDEDAPESLEVDWMKSRGKVALSRNPQTGAARAMITFALR